MKLARASLVVLLAAGALAAGVLAVGWVGYTWLGRTPAEIIAYLYRRLDGHPKLEALANPVLAKLLIVLDEPDSKMPLPPFVVPLLARQTAAPSSGPAAPSLPTPADGDSQQPGPRLIRVGLGQAITSIAAAAKIARDGDTVEIDDGDYIADVAIWDRAALTLRGNGQHVRLIAAGASAEGKAIWIIRRGHITIENISFVGAKASDGNGAGIRFESGHLIVRNCRFHGNQSGILTGNIADATLDVENSEFGYNGAGDGQTHGLYAGRIKSLKVTSSYFHHGNVGQLIKSRAQRNDILYNRLTDESGGRSSYELEFPNGGLARVIGNIIQQGPQTQNSVMVSYGVEGYADADNRLYLAHNTLVNDRPYGGTFVRVAPGAQEVLMRNNLLSGPGQIKGTEVLDAAGDRRVDWSDFAQAAREDYRLKAGHRDALALSPATIAHQLLVPRFEYQHPRQRIPLRGMPAYPGALQTAGP